MLKELDTKVIVSFKYIAELELLKRLLPESYVICGSVKETSRRDVIEAFKSDETKVLLVQEQTVSVSLDLSFCDTIIFYSVGDDLITHSQIRDRLMGRFQKSDQVHYYYLLCNKTIDKKIYKALKNNTKKSELYANWKVWLKGDD
jgi:ERCC4-related helicase